MLDKVINRYLLTLYGTARELPPHEFMQHALDQTRRLIPFDSGLWAVGRPAPVLEPHTIALLDQSPEMMENYTQFKERDHLAYIATQSPFRTIDHTQEVPAALRREIYHEHCRHYGIEQTLCTCSAPRPDSVLHTVVSVYRARRRDEFTTTERRLKEALFPHWIEAASLNLLLYLQSKEIEHQGQGAAVCDRFGFILHADSNFQSLLTAEWKEWDGAQLPWPIRRIVTPRRDGRRIWSGRRLTCHARPLGDAFLVTAARRDALDLLTPRQRQIAELLIQGHTYKAIARQLGLSPSTVTNYANTIYSQLKVRSKTELAALLLPGGRGAGGPRR